MSALLEGVGVELPIVQAGMGGGIARHELAAAVSEAGGLGTLGIASFRRERPGVSPPNPLQPATDPSDQGKESPAASRR
jgi:nitronate monooxygenase